MATTQELINALISKGYNPTDAANAARGSNAANLAREYLGQSVSSDVPRSTVPAGATSNAALPTAPSGGFQQGGWYNGRQYWNGTFSQPGQIHPESNQQGAGSMVSPEVLAATSVAAGKAPGANQAYINSQYSNPSGGAGSTTPSSGAGSGTTGLGSMGSVGVKSSLNLMDEQKKLYDASGITQLQATIAGIQAVIDNNKAEADKRRAEVNENPFLSESSRVGRIRKIDEMLNDTNQTEEAKLANYQASITAKQNEINEKLGLQVKQFDIDKATRAENLDLFNSLLSSGALNSASAQDLGNLSAQTGLPISFITSAIQKATKAEVQIEKQVDDNGNVTILTIDKDTGNILNQVSAGKIGNATNGTGKLTAAETKEEYKANIQNGLDASANSYGYVPPEVWNAALRAWVADGLGTYQEFTIIYGHLRDPNRTDSGTATGYYEQE
jgi:hypothetical protein